MNTGFKIANKECHRNYALISKEQHWISSAKKLEEEKTTRLQTVSHIGSFSQFSGETSVIVTGELAVILSWGEDPNDSTFTNDSTADQNCAIWP